MQLTTPNFGNMKDNDSFDLQDFIPYLLNQAADATSREFETHYKAKYGMLRTEWRVIFHLGRYGDLTAKDICDRARIHKTKVSRAVHALENKGYLSRKARPEDRRHEALILTSEGTRVFDDLYRAAQEFDENLMADFTPEDRANMRRLLMKLARL